ncbi:MAG TPA: N-acetylglucosamine-6-phosphate deacetylase [Gaiellaceae bacterium]|jgi:N-acetylglucosamine-6-phosphate deacetylase
MRLGVAAAIVDGILVVGDVDVDEGRVAAAGLSSRGGTGIAVPGFVDLQVNGFGGVDFADADAAAYTRAGEALLATGVTAYQPTLITAAEHQLVAAIREVDGAPSRPRVIGVHLEGPFISPLCLGAHPAADRRDPDPALAERLLDAGPVSEMTLAPELPGALELIDLLHARGVVVSFGHSNATAAEAARGFDRGVATVTHLFNAMRPWHHRDPGIAGCALAREDVTVQVILDGVHLADETARTVWLAAAGRTALVTDAMSAAGAGDGTYTLGGAVVEVRDGVAARSDGVLAGTALTMIEAVRNLHGLGVPLLEAVAAATSVPAGIARQPELGVLHPGGPADLVVLDDRLEIRSVLVAGRECIAA